MTKKIAIIRVRGRINIRKEIRDTLSMLKLYNKNHCVVIENTPQNMGMIKKVKDFVTYGEIEEELYKELVTKKGEEYTGREKDSKEKIDYSRRYLVLDNKKYKKYFRLGPPRKGYGKEGIKKVFSKNGALGNRGEKINDIIRRMI